MISFRTLRLWWLSLSKNLFYLNVLWEKGYAFNFALHFPLPNANTFHFCSFFFFLFKNSMYLVKAIRHFPPYFSKDLLVDILSTSNLNMVAVAVDTSQWRSSSFEINFLTQSEVSLLLLLSQWLIIYQRNHIKFLFKFSHYHANF